MNAKELISAVKAEKEKDWLNSDVLISSEKLLEQIAEHFERCAECREAFDEMEYEETTLVDFASEYIDHTDLQDWICEGVEEVE